MSKALNKPSRISVVSKYDTKTYLSDVFLLKNVSKMILDDFGVKLENLVLRGIAFSEQRVEQTQTVRRRKIW